MPCYHPVISLLNPTTRDLVYNIKNKSRNQIIYFLEHGYKECPVPCGRCIGCVKKNASDWVCRLSAEMFKFQQGYFGRRPCSFITLTFDNDNLPGDYKVNMHPEYISKFFKKIKDYRYDNGLPPIKYYAVPEYGDKNGRLHFHAIVFGEDFLQGDKLVVHNRKGRTHYITDGLNRFWPYGRATTDPSIGENGLGAICYTANYLKNDKRITCRFVLKNVNGETDIYQEFDKKFHSKQKLLRNSKNLGQEVYDQYKEQLARQGYFRLQNGRVCGCPRHWIKKMKEKDVELVPYLQQAFEKLSVGQDRTLSNYFALEYVDLQNMKNHVKTLDDEEYTDITELNNELWR